MMQTLKKVVTDKWVETQCKELKWAIVSLQSGDMPEYVMARVDSYETAKFFKEKLVANYPNEMANEWFEVRECTVY